MISIDLAEALERELPSALLLLGPDLRKKTLAVHLQELHTIAEVDRLWVSWLSVEAVGRVQAFALTAPHGKLRVVVIDLHRATSAALNRLLKLLEEPPETVRFVLLAREEPLATIRSRAQVITFGQGSDSGLSEAQAKARSAALAALKAARSGDFSLLRTAMRDWGAGDSQMLSCWCEERLSGCWNVFTATDSTAGTQFARRLLAALAANSSARPRLAARTALEVASRMER